MLRAHTDPIYRVVRVRISRNGFRTRCVWVATTLADTRRYPAQKLAELYFRRWSIELFYRDVKTTMHMEVLRTKSPQMIEKELLMHAIAYNAIRALILRSAMEHQQELGRLSFKGGGGPAAPVGAAGCCLSPSATQAAAWDKELRESIACASKLLRPGGRNQGLKNDALTY